MKKLEWILLTDEDHPIDNERVLVRKDEYDTEFIPARYNNMLGLYWVTDDYHLIDLSEYKWFMRIN